MIIVADGQMDIAISHCKEYMGILVFILTTRNPSICGSSRILCNNKKYQLLVDILFKKIKIILRVLFYKCFS